MNDKHENKHFFSKSKHVAISRNTYLLSIRFEGIIKEMRMSDNIKTSIFSESKHVAISRNTYALCIGIKGIETKNRNNKQRK